MRPSRRLSLPALLAALCLVFAALPAMGETSAMRGEGKSQGETHAFPAQEGGGQAVPSSAQGDAENGLHAAPARQNPKTRKWRIAYFEGGPFGNYRDLLAATARGLEKTGLVANGQVPVPRDEEETGGMWKWLARHAGGSRVEFLEDGHYSSNWDGVLHREQLLALLKRIQAGEVDMVISMGTWCGMDLAEASLDIPVFCMSVSDPVDAGIAKSAEDSGKDNLHAQMEPGRFKKQIYVFHRIFKFKRLGIVYEDSLPGRYTCALDEIEEAAKDLGVELVRATTVLDLPDKNHIAANMEKCHAQLAEQCDAVYITLNSLPGSLIPRVIAPLVDKAIPTFSQRGSSEVRAGVLLSMSQRQFDDLGLFEAEAIAQVADGAKPRGVSQIFEPELGLSFNFWNAKKIGWNPPLELLAAMDEIFQSKGDNSPGQASVRGETP